MFVLTAITKLMYHGCLTSGIGSDLKNDDVLIIRTCFSESLRSASKQFSFGRLPSLDLKFDPIPTSITLIYLLPSSELFIALKLMYYYSRV